MAGDGSGDFLQLQAAVDAAASGDVILVRPFTERYGATKIQGKALTIVGYGDVRPGVEEVSVSDLPAGDTVRLRFLDLLGTTKLGPFFTYYTNDGLTLANTAGCVWLEDLILSGTQGLSSSGDLGQGRIGLVAVASDCVVLVSSQAFGGDGSISTGGSISYMGGHGIRLTGSRLACYGSTCLGGRGFDGGFNGPSYGAKGGAGLESTTSTVFSSGSVLTGGDTGSGKVPSKTPTASGLFLIDGSSASYLATSIQAGGGFAPPGPDVGMSGSPSTADDLADDDRHITLPAAVRELDATQVAYAGQPGDRVLLQLSLESAWAFVPALKGTLQLGAVAASVYLGVADSSGAIGVSFSAPVLPAGVEALAGYAQPVVAETDGSLRLGAPSSFLLLDASIPPP